MNKLEKEAPIPCINCISLPVCISLTKKYNVEHFPEDKDFIIMTRETFLFLSSIRKKCSTIDNYLGGYNLIDNARADLLLNYFCGED
jgi:hypothetical protein